MMLFCRHCFKDRPVTLRRNGPHIEARCRVCKEHVKFLNRKEKVAALIEEAENSHEQHRIRSRREPVVSYKR